MSLDYYSFSVTDDRTHISLPWAFMCKQPTLMLLLDEEGWCSPTPWINFYAEAYKHDWWRTELLYYYTHIRPVSASELRRYKSLYAHRKDSMRNMALLIGLMTDDVVAFILRYNDGSDETDE